MRLRSLCLGLAVCATAGTGHALAQPAWPAKPVRLVVPFPAGGFSDVMVRLITPGLGERLGQPVVVDNRPGASGNLGAELVARAAPDGHTLLANSANFTVNAAIQPRLPFDSVRDFAPVILLAETPLVVVVHPSLPARSVRELLAVARARPDQLNYASSGIGTTGHIVGEYLNMQGRVRMVHVPYKGSGGNMLAVVTGEVAVTFPNMPPAIPLVKSGRLRALAVTSARRSQVEPSWPTVAESGLPGFELSGWIGVAAPAGTPRAVIERTHRELVALLAQTDLRDRFLAQGAEPVAGTPDGFAAYVLAQIARIRAIADAAKLRAE